MSASETHNQKNLNRTQRETLSAQREVIESAKAEDLVVRAGQPIAKIKFERMVSEPEFHYDTKASNYLTQSGPKLGKQFK